MTQGASGTVIRPFNRMMAFLLRTPFHSIASRSVMLITFTGRKTGQKYTTPISYLQEDNHVTAFSNGKWIVNLIGGAPVTLYIRRQELYGIAEPVEDKLQIATGLRHFLSRVRSDARFYKVAFDDDGQPNASDCTRAAEKITMIHIRLNGK